MLRFLSILVLLCGLAFQAAAQAQTVGPWVTGVASSTDTAAHQLIAAPPSTVTEAIFITGAQCGRNDAGTTAVNVTFNDTNSSVLVLPNSGGGGGNNATFITPITPGPNTKFTFTVSSGITTVTCSAQGFIR